MRRTLSAAVTEPLRARLRTVIVSTMGFFLVAFSGESAPAIEMFTFYGDGSRIGLPSLEVPIEAYPGIPLRSDRLRARRRAQRLGPNAATRIGPPGYARGITIRAMPMPQETAPLPRTTAGQPSASPMPPDPILFDDEPEAEPAIQPPEKARGEAEKISAPAPAS